MATNGKLLTVQADHDSDWRDVVVERYRVSYDTAQTNPFTALTLAQNATGTPLPRRRQQYNTADNFLFCTKISGKPTDESRLVWVYDVTWEVPPDGELTIFQSLNQAGPTQPPAADNPILRPAVFDISYIEEEEVVANASNLVALPHGNGAGGNRAAGTFAPITNAAGRRPDEPILDTSRYEVLVIRKNYATLADIVARNRAYRRTVNSGAIQGYGARELRYLLTQSQGQTFENGYTYYPGVTQILAKDSHDIQIDNVGTEYWDTVSSDWKQVTVKDASGEDVPAVEPANLTLAGGLGGDLTTAITYQHLTGADYSPLFV